MSSNTKEPVPAACSSGAAETQEPEASAATSDPAPEPALPPLTPSEFREYNRLAEHMDLFHSHFRHTWTLLYSACTNNKRPASLSLRQFIDEGLRFVHTLTMHHNIEETYFFPMLATRMPEFQPASKGNKKNKEAAELLRQHKQIHAGMDVFEEYLRKCKNRETELELSVLKEKMDCWGEVLWKHLDQEVRTLGAENMRKYWTVEEVRRIGM